MPCNLTWHCVHKDSTNRQGHWPLVAKIDAAKIDAAKIDACHNSETGN